MIIVGPIVGAHFRSRPMRVETVDASQYLSLRSPVIDRLLPGGSGGTHFVRELSGPAGEANVASASIRMEVPKSARDGEAIELHERAHLLEAFALPAARRILEDLPAPAPDLYAAESPAEHFAEMAASAWSLMKSFDEVCVLDVEGVLDEAEQNVPGTAGFVARFLGVAPLADTVSSSALLASARRTIARRAADWDSLWSAVDGRRLHDGRFDAWRE
jgi:hypothetical protein